MTLERKKHRVAVVVFLEVEGYDECDAGSGGELAVRQALTGRRMGLPVDTEFVAANGKNTASIVDVMELGRAAGNGYLWTRPTRRTWLDIGRDLFYVECIECGMARATNDRRSVGTFKQIHEEDTGHKDFYQGPMPAERPGRIKVIEESP